MRGQIHVQAILNQGIKSLHSLARKLGRSQKDSECSGVGKNFVPMSRIEPRYFGRSAYNPAKPVQEL
jgi:hypothetical protein